MNYKKEIEILLKKLPHKLQVKYALSCAESVFHLVEDEDKPGVRKSLDTTALWLVDKASADEVYAAIAAYAASASASYVAASYAYYAASYAAASAYAYAASVTAASVAASYAANSDFAAKAKGKNLKHYYEELVRMIKDLTELDKLIYNI